MQLYNADCLDILKAIPDKSIDLIVTDPPYKISGGVVVAALVWRKEHIIHR